MTPSTAMDPADAFQELLYSVGIKNDHYLMERRFAVSIDGHDWSYQVWCLRLGFYNTIIQVPPSDRDDDPPHPTIGRRTASLILTLRRSEDAEALVGTIPEDGRANAVVILLSEDRATAVVHRFVATTLIPPWDTTAETDATSEYFDSAWFLEETAHDQVPTGRPG